MFTKAMTNRLVELIRERREDLFPSSRKANAAFTQIAAWRQITDILNREFPENAKTLKQVQCKWKNIRQEVRDDVLQWRRRRRNHGNGFNGSGLAHSLNNSSGGYGNASSDRIFDAESVENESPPVTPSDQLSIFLQNMMRSQHSGGLLTDKLVDASLPSFVDAALSGGNASNANGSVNGLETTASHTTDQNVQKVGSASNLSAFIANMAASVNGNGIFPQNSDFADKSLLLSLTSGQQLPPHLKNSLISEASSSNVGDFSAKSRHNSGESSVGSLSSMNERGNKRKAHNGECDDNFDVPKRGRYWCSSDLMPFERKLLVQKLANAKKEADLFENVNQFLSTATMLMNKVYEKFFNDSTPSSSNGAAEANKTIVEPTVGGTTTSEEMGGYDGESLLENSGVNSGNVAENDNNNNDNLAADKC